MFVIAVETDPKLSPSELLFSVLAKYPVLISITARASPRASQTSIMWSVRDSFQIPGVAIKLYSATSGSATVSIALRTL